jgi:hypothetical protein
MVLVVGALVLLLSLLQSVTDFSHELVMHSQLLVHVRHVRRALRVWEHVGRVAPVHHTEWACAQGALEGRVLIELGPREPLYLVVRAVTSEAMHVHGDNFVHCLRLAIRLWVEGGRHVQADAEELEELAPEVTSEVGQ